MDPGHRDPGERYGNDRKSSMNQTFWCLLVVNLFELEVEYDSDV